MSMRQIITLSYSMIKVKSQREKETWQMIPQSSPSPSWAALQHNKVINLFPGEKIILKTFQRYRGQPEVSQPSRILGAAWEKKRSTLKYIFDLCLHGETIREDSTNIRYLQVGELNLGDQVGGAENNHNLEHRVLQVNISFYRAQGVAGKHISFYRAQGVTGKNIFL